MPDDQKSEMGAQLIGVVSIRTFALPPSLTSGGDEHDGAREAEERVERGPLHGLGPLDRVGQQHRRRDHAERHRHSACVTMHIILNMVFNYSRCKSIQSGHLCTCQ